MADPMEADLRKLYGYPEDMTYEQFAKSKRDEAERLLEEGDTEGAVGILRLLCDSVKGDQKASMRLGDLYRDGKYMRKDPWMSMLYYCAAFSDEGDRMSTGIWDALCGFRTMLLDSRPLGRLELNEQDAESACCSKMKEYLCKGAVSMSNIDDDPKECTFSMTISKADYKQYVGKEKHEMSGSPDPKSVTPMDLCRCPFCKAPLNFRRVRSPEWDQFAQSGF
ncbi:MAG: hypothetical protein PUK31_03565 [Candidatus Methanomethylophilaceae archaeon]|nr:hypothetical protein [Candidatus Methanomethylophilaceae archaeon]MDY5871697.1 hypothetical protein [Candidatus Methanomethylophilaceae archaeon]